MSFVTKHLSKAIMKRSKLRNNYLRNKSEANRIQKLSEYLPSMKLDDYSFELHQERVDK